MIHNKKKKKIHPIMDVCCCFPNIPGSSPRQSRIAFLHPKRGSGCMAEFEK